MYQTDFLCTYKHSLKDNDNNNDNDHDHDKITGYEIDELYKAQFLQAFDCEDCGYNDKKIAEGLKEVRSILEGNKEGKKFLAEAIKQGLPLHLSIFASLCGDNDDAITDTIIRSYYGFQTMDLMHEFVCKIKNGNEVSKGDWKFILNQYRDLFMN